MAEYSFYVRSVTASLQDQSVYIDCSMDIDSDTATPENIFVFTKKTHIALPFDVIIDKTRIQLKAKTWISPNEEYMIFIESGIKSITDDNLDASLARSIIFKSDVTSEIAILSPVNFEYISQELKIKFQETGKLLTSKYYLEVSTENAFYNIQYKTHLICNGENGITTCSLASLPDGQYYMRVRAQKDETSGDYGKWSDVITFICSASTKETAGSTEQKQKETDTGTASSTAPSVVDMTKTDSNASSTASSSADSTSSSTSTTTTDDTTKMYCTLESLKMLVDTFNIPDQNMISYIKNASKEVDFLTSSLTTTTTSNSFAKEQYTRTRATIDCLSRFLMSRITSGGGAKYTLDTATYEDSMNTTSLKNLLNDLYKELQKWQDAMRGYVNEGRAKPKATRIGIKSSQNSDVSAISLDSILADITRSVPQWS